MSIKKMAPVYPERLRCSSCGTVKHHSEFGRDKTCPGRGYRKSYCRPCETLKRAERRAIYRPAIIDTVSSTQLTAGGMTLQECADELGLSRERVRQIEQEALQKMRLILTAAGFSQGDFV